MVTIVDPSGTPSIVYNRSGTTVVSVSGGTISGSSPVGNDGVAIPRQSQITVALVSGLPTGVTSGVVVLPDSSEIGDVVEVYSLGQGSGVTYVFPPVGVSIGTLPASTGTDSTSNVSVARNAGRIFRLTSASNWQVTN